MIDEQCTLTFILGDREEQTWSNVVPRIGDKISMWSTRDDHGNYVHERPKERLKGVVKKVEHIFEERGTDSRSNTKSHDVRITLSKR